MRKRIQFRRLPRVDSGTYWIGYQDGSVSPTWVRWAGPGEGLTISLGSMFVPLESDRSKGIFARMIDAERAVRQFEEEVSQ